MTAVDITKAPSLQNAVAFIGKDARETEMNIREFAGGDVRPSYEPARTLAPHLMVGRSFEWCQTQLASVRWLHQRKINEDVLALLSKHRESISPIWYRRPDKVSYQNRGLTVPVQPLGVWSDGQSLIVDWMQPWKDRELSELHRNILYTILKQRFFIGDYFPAKFNFLDLGAGQSSKVRRLTVLTDDDFSMMSQETLDVELNKLLEALAAYEASPEPKKSKRSDRDDKTGDLFGEA